MKRHKHAQAGITLIEMLVVVTIIALFVGIVGLRVFQAGDKAKVTTTRLQIRDLTNALGLYKLDTGVYPSTTEGLRALIAKPDNATNWSGPYLEKVEIPQDAWARPFLYKYPGDHGDTPDLVSNGADGQPGGEGINADIVNWSNQ